MQLLYLCELIGKKLTAPESLGLLVPALMSDSPGFSRLTKELGHFVEVVSQ